jgi:hypothetical protein
MVYNGTKYTESDKYQQEIQQQYKKRVVKFSPEEVIEVLHILDVPNLPTIDKTANLKVHPKINDTNNAFNTLFIYSFASFCISFKNLLLNISQISLFLGFPFSSTSLNLITSHIIILSLQCANISDTL